MGEQIEGVVIDLDDEHVHLVVPSHHGTQHMPGMGQPYRYPFGYGFGYGYPPYGYGYGLSRLIIPLTFVAALSALPW
ncbi:hypothetical protein [Alkalibacillus aidingensis]|uniref:hypothetical protein n=1 Tax=Alkalibacillus aidingensis TaxID=2747607 RepID=UPI0016603A2D|nr:hypothetical protein [Alkalibacillus aidingensis]